MGSIYSDNESTTNRRRQQDLIDAQDQRLSQSSQGTPKALFQVISLGAIPSSLPAVFAAQRVVMTGPETEGSAPSSMAYTGTTFITVIGTRVPGVGDYLKGRLVNGRWIAETHGTFVPGHTLPGCTCPNIPDTIYMRVASPRTAHATLNDSYTYFPVVPSSLRFQTRPADTIPTGATIVINSPAYYSDAKYPAYIYTGQWLLNGTIRFYMYCSGISGFYTVGLIYTGDAPQSLSGPSSYTGNFSYLAGFPGGQAPNTCAPFTMTSGTYANSSVKSLGITLNTTASDSPPGRPIVMPPAPPKPAVAAPVMPRFS